MWFSLIAHASAIRLSLRLVTADRYFAPTAACVPCALALLLLAVGYAIWLGGATIAGWRLPAWTHAAPIGLLAMTLVAGPLLPSLDRFAAMGPTDRAVAAMQHLALAAGRDGGGSPCALPAGHYGALLRSASEVPWSGFRSYGRRVPFEVVVRDGQSGPVRERRSEDRAGSIYLACDPGGRRFWISAVVSDGLPTGRPTLLRDGVGKVVFEAGEVPR